MILYSISALDVDTASGACNSLSSAGVRTIGLRYGIVAGLSQANDLILAPAPPGRSPRVALLLSLRHEGRTLFLLPGCLGARARAEAVPQPPVSPQGHAFLHAAANISNIAAGSNPVRIIGRGPLSTATTRQAAQ